MMDSGWESIPITALVITAGQAAAQTICRTSYSLVQQMYYLRFCIKNKGIYWARLFSLISKVNWDRKQLLFNCQFWAPSNSNKLNI